MQIDFTAAGSAGQSDVNPTLVCSAPSGEAAVSCHLEQTDGVSSIIVESGGTRQLRRTEPPFAFSLHRSDLVEVVGQHQFQVVVHDAEGRPIRRFSRTISQVR
jgi:hypothetical protein